MALTLALAQGPMPDLREGSIGGGRLLRDEKCMVASAVSAEQWGLRQVSRAFLIEKGLSPTYFDQHFCALSISYEYSTILQGNGKAQAWRGYGYAWVTYKAMFDPYLTWWQHRFPVVVNSDNRPLLMEGVAVVDVSRTVGQLPQFHLVEIRALLTPEEARNRMQALIGGFVGPLDVLMGPLEIGPEDRATGKVRLYVSATNENPNADNCGNTSRFGAIDVETGEGVVRFSGDCPGPRRK